MTRRRGTDEDFRALVSRERPGLIAASAMITGGRATAEEIVQDVLERTYVRWSDVSRKDRPGAWVRRAVINQSISATRRSGRERRAMERLRSRVVVVLEEPEVAMAEVWSAVQDLPEHQATAVALYYGADLALATVAQEMDLTPAAAKALLHRARHALRQNRDLQEMVQ